MLKYTVPLGDLYKHDIVQHDIAYIIMVISTVIMPQILCFRSANSICGPYLSSSDRERGICSSTQRNVEG